MHPNQAKKDADFAKGFRMADRPARAGAPLAMHLIFWPIAFVLAVPAVVWLYRVGMPMLAGPPPV